MINTLYKPFRHWSDKKSVYLISDTHFDDYDRPLMGYHIDEKDQLAEIKKYCQGQCLIHLGDVGNPEYLNELRCYKVLIKGNHDNNLDKYFDEVYSGPLWISQKIVLSHEPLYLICAHEQIAFNIHGHDHSYINRNDTYHLNIAQNVFGYEPLNLKEFINSGALKKVNDIHRSTIDLASRRK